MAKRASRKVVRQPDIETVHTVSVGLAMCRCGLKQRHIQGRGLQIDLSVIDGLSEKVIRPNLADDVIARLKATLMLLSFFREFDRNFELGKSVSLHVDGDFGSIRGSVGIAHQRPQMIRTKIDLVGEGKFGRGYAVLVGLGSLLENFVAA